MTILERDKSACESSQSVKTSTEPISLKFIIGDTIARGKFGIVKQLTNRENGNILAGKFIKNIQRGDMQREANLLSEVCHHPFIIGLEMFYQTPKNEMVIVMELAKSDIFEYCVGQEKTFTEEESKGLCRQLAAALEFIHSKYIVHLDIKPQNILLSKDGTCKLADFGLSRKILPGQVVQEICGTPEYTAPEILDYNPITAAADIWSLGTVLYVMLTGYSPFAGETIQETYLNVATAELDFEEDEWQNHSTDAIQMIEMLCQTSPKDRPKASELLQQNWLKTEESEDNNNSPPPKPSKIPEEIAPVVRRRTRRSRKRAEDNAKQFVQNNQSGDSDSGVSLPSDEDSSYSEEKTAGSHTATRNRKSESAPDFFARREQRRKQYLLKMQQTKETEPTTYAPTQS